MGETSAIRGSEFKPDFRYEQIQFFFRKHWTHFLKLALLGLFVGLLMALVLVAFYGMILLFGNTALRSFFVFFTILSVALYLHFFCLAIINYFFDLVIVTDVRIIVSCKTVFLKSDSGAIDLTKIQDIRAETRGIFQNYLRFGRLIITLSAGTPSITIESVARPHYYLEQANRVKREQILKRQERRFKPAPEEAPEEPSSVYLQDVRELLNPSWKEEIS